MFFYTNECPTGRPFLRPLREIYRVDNTFCKTSLSWLYFPLLFVLYYGLFLVKNYHGLSAIPTFLHRLHSQVSSRAWARKCHSQSSLSRMNWSVTNSDCSRSAIFGAHTKLLKMPVNQAQARGMKTRLSHTRSKIE